MLIENGEPTGEVVSAAEERARLLRAHRIHEARLVACVRDGGDPEDEEESVEAEAGALLEAETAVAIWDIHLIAKAWLEAHKR